MTTGQVSISERDLSSLLPMDKLVEALRTSFKVGCHAPPREHHEIDVASGENATLLLMPAWSKQGPRRYLGVKQVNVFPGNARISKPALTSIYNLFDGDTGEHLASMDGNTITGRRTVAVSALAASYLSRPDATTLTVVGSGRVASLIPYAYKAVRDIQHVKIWDIDPASAERLRLKLTDDGFGCEIVESLEQAVNSADIVSAATLSRTPLVLGKWLHPGTHVDLIGAFTADMRESDDECIARADVYVDTMEAFHEAGDLIQPQRSNAIDRDHVKGTLADIVSGRLPGRQSRDAVTVFKAVGTALADLSAASLAYEGSSKQFKSSSRKV
jgi:ornithine cyclodeaminase/alanine dehydrogenase-like protein (mu-crystallin family)